MAEQIIYRADYFNFFLILFNSTDIGRFLLLQKFVTTVKLMCTCKALAEDLKSEFAYM